MEPLTYNLTPANWAKELPENTISFATEAYLDYFDEAKYIHTHEFYYYFEIHLQIFLELIMDFCNYYESIVLLKML